MIFWIFSVEWKGQDESQIHLGESKTEIYIGTKIKRTLIDCVMVWTAFSHKIFSRKPSENACDTANTKKDCQRN